MESFIIRLYRRNEGNDQEFAGLLEAVNSGLRTPFHSAGELLSLLSLDADEHGTSKTGSKRRTSPRKKSGSSQQTKARNG
ncbi:MAG: hypothetical protein JNM76_16975 [Betaproteobacteria bacterium]|nr:hypothetical protein [Betaproteobacteria bacterium]